MNHHPPRLSIIIPTFNAGVFLAQAVQSALSQAPALTEVIVIDDGSTDASLKSIEHLPIQIIRKKNAGVSSARNAGIRAAKGEFITFLDADDCFVPNAFSKRLKHLSQNKDSWATGGLPSSLIDEKDQTLADVYPTMFEKFQPPFQLSFDDYVQGRFFPVQCSLYIYRAAVFAELGHFDETLRAAEDCDFLFRLLKLKEIQVLDERTFDRRIHQSNLSMARDPKASFAFRDDVLRAIETVNRRHGMDPKSIVPWELDYLHKSHDSPTEPLL